MKKYHDVFGEFIGSSLMVFMGCGSVAIAVLYYPLSLWQVALMWSVAVTLAIYTVKGFSHAHLNPAVTLAMAITQKTKWLNVPMYFFAQLAGAVFASFVLYALINKDLQAFEHAQALVRGEVNSYHSAVMFGEFFPNPGYESSLQVSPLKAGVAEGIGTFVLVLVIFILSAKEWRLHKWVPVLIGLLVGGIILCLAPYTQAGINPARDFGPRLVAYFSGWGEAAFPAVRWSFFTVYIVSPMLGGAAAAFLFKRIMSMH